MIRRAMIALTLAASVGLGAAVGMVATSDNSIEGVNEVHGSIETIRGIEGIDTVMLQNLEAVLRMQQRPQEQQSQGGARAAAALLTMEPSEAEPIEEDVDGRQVHVAYETEGS
jgi:hypothetical protein